MSKLPSISGKKLIKILDKLGFQVIRQKGSHVFLEHPDKRTTIVPIHANESIDKGLLVKIIKKDVKISTEKFLTFLKK